MGNFKRPAAFCRRPHALSLGCYSTPPRSRAWAALVEKALRISSSQLPKGGEHLCRKVPQRRTEPSLSLIHISTLYLAGREASTGELLHDATSCSMCRRTIINAGIDRVVIRNTDKDYSVVHVEDWIREDDSLPEKQG